MSYLDVSNLGFLIIIISLVGYLSNWLNVCWLNFRITQWLYFLGAFIHELSHAILCILTGAKIVEFKVFSRQPHVSHLSSRLPLIGQLLISIAPIFGGLFFLYAINYYLLQNYFVLAVPQDIWQVLAMPVGLFYQFNFLQWQTWLFLILMINSGAMIGLSWQDLKNFWPLLLIGLFVNAPFVTPYLFLAISLLVCNVILQLMLILIIKLILLFRR
ncbi:MAG: hypothetical protein COX77_02745 [Candidatus Komeilibacteria bacterium CG_4_10_14_0_2_um_filter_37_10]|uniref:Uncharacterized protein n=1 Tax=Candidatus Komeilibacteria bacterium CG_4_10_14_0_2_um_filter_37_10 TaxID=1974470 RepID=A0A2M7VEQ6_9BACT|nr:MAG: hypothetical protein COX77_02745 [Candidatus Komeilibacteria bacterium CG_4_10_14_0_2_um_filter_37_10]